MGERYGAVVHQSVGAHLEPSSRRTYARGTALFNAFCLEWNVPADFALVWPTDHCQYLGEIFAAHLRTDFSLASSTIDQYFSHFLSSLKQARLLYDSDTIRSERLGMMMTAFSKADAEGRPARTVIKIPLTASLLVVAFKLLRSLYANPAELPVRLALACALSLGYGLSLRPDEYLVIPRSTSNKKHIARGYKSSFRWSDDPNFYSVLHPSSYPNRPDPPTIFVTFIDGSKRDDTGKGAPRAIVSDDPSASFNLVSNIFDCLRRYPPLANGPLLSGLPFSMTHLVVSRFLKKLALHAGLDPRRLVPHSPRVAALMQLSDHDSDTHCRQGNWSDPRSLTPYVRGSLKHAYKVSANLHDTSTVDVEYLRLMFMTPP
jgi:hypothetical protein